MPEPTRPEKPAVPQPPVHETASSADDHTGGLRPPEEDLAFLEKPQGPGEIGRLGSFRILKELGRGGMGCVLLAEDTQLERLVALKIMLPRFAQDETARTRFLREAKAAAKIHQERYAAGTCAVSSRSRNTPAPRNNNTGLRVARIPSGEAPASK